MAESLAQVLAGAVGLGPQLCGRRLRGVAAPPQRLALGAVHGALRCAYSGGKPWPTDDSPHQGHRDVTSFTSQDLDGMDNSVNSGVMHDLILQTVGGAFLTGVVPSEIQLAPGFVVPITDYIMENINLGLLMVDTINEFGSAPVFSTYALNEYEQDSHERQG